MRPLVGTLPFIYMANHGFVIMILACALFVRGVGMSAVSVPSVSAAYSSVKREDLPMATTTLNIVMHAYRRTHSDDDLCNLSGMEIRICAQPRCDAQRFYGGLCSAVRLPWPFDCRRCETSSFGLAEYRSRLFQIDRHD